MKERVDSLEKDLRECKTEVGQEVQSLKEELDEMKQDIKELLFIFKNAKGFFRFSGWIVKGFLITGAITGATVAIRTFFKGW